MAIHLNMP